MHLPLATRPANVPKWHNHQRNVSVGDIVLMKDNESHRNNRPLGRITEVTPSPDGKVRKAKVTTWKGGSAKNFDRPICGFVLLVRQEEES